MLRIFAGESPLTRRQLLTLGAAGWGGLFPWFGGRSGWARELAVGDDALTGRSIIYIFQQGGPSQHETWDPKESAPEGVRTVTPVINTALPGVRFGASMPRLAAMANDLTIVRSFQTNNGGHNLRPLVGPESLEANIGVHFARLAGVAHPATGMPTGAVLHPPAVDPAAPRAEARGDLRATGPYGRAYAPFVPGGGGQLQDDMELHLPRGRVFDDRRELLRRLDQLSRRRDASGELAALDDLQSQAYRLLESGGVSRALDLSLEDPRTVAEYDTAAYCQPGRWRHAARGKRGYYDAQAKTLGKLLLLSRRLCEAGCGFVTVHAGYAGVWDMHADGNNLNMVEGMEAVGRSFDHALAALLSDIRRRGLSDKILVVASGEMGRTPRLNKRGGRDHWGKLAPLLLCGGGLPAGRVIGQSTRDGGEPLTEPNGPRNLISTVLQALVDPGRLRLDTSAPAELASLLQPPPIGS